jgi:hypothetical protein
MMSDMYRLRDNVECFSTKLPTDPEPIVWNVLLGFVFLIALTTALRLV